MSLTKTPAPAVLAKPEGLSQKQEAFAQAYVRLGSVVDAYVEAYATRSTTNRNSLRSTAYNTLKHPAVARRVAALQAAAAAGSITSTAELVDALAEMAEADLNELCTLTVGACRHCWGKGGARHWRDVDEYTLALARAIDRHEPLPDEHGGYGYRNDREPNADCNECHGCGVPRVRFTNTADVSRGARRLLKGIELHADGTPKRLHFHDQLAIRTELHRLLGMHVDRAINLNVNANVPDLRHMSREEQLDLLESIKPTPPAPTATPAPVVLDVTPEPAP
jgi:hypothetical protein